MALDLIVVIVLTLFALMDAGVQHTNNSE